MSDVDQVFGDWYPPAHVPHIKIAAPTDRVCGLCEEHFQEGDSGVLRHEGNAYQPPGGEPSIWAVHKECLYRSVVGGIGHLIDHDYFCGGELGPDAGLSFRTSALLVWNYCTVEDAERAFITRDSLLLLSGRLRP